MVDDGQIEIVQVEPRRIATVHATVPMMDLPRAQREARALLAAALTSAGLEAGKTLTLWRPPQAGSMDYAPGVFVADEFQATGSVGVEALPEGRAAHLRMNGAYTELPGAWQRLFAECSQQGLALAGLNWEIYGASSAEGGADLYALLA